ncbi:hypothetical protein M0805_007262 [Coniferiporia weirii]|nr:hypothetical protein M0805_007262 [Coniferiporia weirii]
MSVSLVSCLARSTRCAGSRSAAHAAFLPVRSLTRLQLQRGRPLVQSGQVSWALGSARSFSWNPWVGAPKLEVQTPPAPVVGEAPAASHTEVLQENASSAVESTSQATSAVDTSAVIQPDGVLVDPAAASALSDSITGSLADVASVVSSIPGPTQYGDMAALGLVSWSPAGFFPWLLEVTQVTTGLPWWGAIILTTIGARAALLPLIVRGQRTQGRLAPIQPLLAEVRQKADKARADGDKMAMQQAMLQQQGILKKAGVNPLDQILTSVAQVCVQIGFFIGLRRMCTVPVEQLTVGGFGWITDLTVPDPLFIMPVVNFALINLQLYVSQRDMLAVGTPAAPHILNGLRAATLLSIPFMLYFPAGLNIHFITSISFIAAQTLILRIPSLRSRLRIAPLPPLPEKKLPTMRDTGRFVKEWYAGRMAAAQLQEAERMRKMRMVKAPPRR